MLFNIDTFKELLGAAAILTPIVTGLTQVIKVSCGLTDGRFVPLIAVILGLALGVLVIQMSVFGGLVGVVIGLSAVGLYEVGGKSKAILTGDPY